MNSGNVQREKSRNKHKSKYKPKGKFEEKINSKYAHIKTKKRNNRKIRGRTMIKKKTIKPAFS